MPPSQPVPGSGTLPPTSLPNPLIFTLFGLLGAGFVLSSIWFFFWASNGGFHWRKTDWDDYKTTVLRRRGPNGTILSGGTASTRLGGGSVVGKSVAGDLEKGDRVGIGGRERTVVKNSQDRDVRAYRAEKVARVGGINKMADGDLGVDVEGHKQQRGSYKSSSRRDHKTTVSSAGASETASNHSDGLTGDGDRQYQKRSQRGQHQESPRGQDSSRGQGQSQSQSQSQKPIRHVPRSTKDRHTPRSSTQHNSHTTNHTTTAAGSSAGDGVREGRYTDPLDFQSHNSGSVYGEGTNGSGSGMGSEQIRNTKAYFHPIPGLTGSSRGGGGGAQTQASTRGYRRDDERDGGSRY